MIETSRLRLRAMTIGDAPFILRLFSSISFRDGVGDRGVNDLEAARRYIETGPVACRAAHGHALDLIETRDSLSAVGICGLVRREGLDGPDLGYALDETAVGRGYATEAGAAALRHAEEALGVRRVWAVVKPTNTASIAVLARLRFAPASTIMLHGVQTRLYAWSASPG